MTVRMKMLAVACFILLLAICFLSSRMHVDAASGPAVAASAPLAPVPSAVSFQFASESVGEADGTANLTLQRSGDAAGALVAKITQTSGAALFSRTDLDGSFGVGTGADNTVRASALKPTGEILIAGDFTTFNGISRPRVARLNTNGSLDASFHPGTGASNTVNAMALQGDGRVVIGGAFTSYDLSARNHVARLNANGSLDTTFNPGTGTNGSVRAVAVQPDGKIIIAGAFSTYNGTARSRLARLNPDGSLDTSFNIGNGANGNIQTILLQPDGKIIIGGFFTGYNSTSRARVARLNADGSIDATFNPGAGPNNTVQAMALQPDGKLVIGGSFTADGVARPGIARLNPDGSLDASFDPGAGATSSGSPFVFGIDLQPDGKIIIAGNFTSYDGTARNHVARLNPDGSLDTSFDPGTAADLNAQAVVIQPDGRIIVGGSAIIRNGVLGPSLVRLNSNGSLDTTFNPSGLNGSVTSIALQPDGRVIIGGQFTGGVRRLNTDGSRENSFNATTSLVQTVSLQPDGKIIVGGSFNTVNGATHKGIVRLKADGSTDDTLDMGTGLQAGGNTGQVFGIALQPDGGIVVGGFFDTYNGLPRNNLLRLRPAPGVVSFNTNEFIVGEWEPSANVGLSRTGGTDNRVVAKVSLTDITTSPQDYLATQGALDASFNPGQGPNGTVLASALQRDGRLVIGGSFSAYRSASRAGLARVNPDGSLDPSFNLGSGVDAPIWTTLLQPDGRIIIGGQFTTFNGMSRKRIARVNQDGSLDFSFNDSGGGADQGVVYATAQQVYGHIMIGGDFNSYNGTACNRIARLNANGSLDTTFNPGTGADNPAHNAIVYAIAVQPDHKTLIGGDFNSYNGTARNRLARLNYDGSLDTSFDPGAGANGAVRGFALLPDGRIIVVGRFTSFNGTNCTNIARLNADGSLDSTFNPGGTGTEPNASIITAALLFDGKIIIGGGFQTYNGAPRLNFARLNQDGTLDTSFETGTGADGPVFTLVQQTDGRIIIGGGLVNYNGTARRSVARVNGDLYAVWEAGDASDKTIQLPIVDDTLDEPSESLEFSVTPLSGRATTDTNSTALLSIIDNDLADTGLSSVSGVGTANAPLTLTATLFSQGTPLSGRTISFALFGTPVGTAQTDASGVATLTIGSLPGVAAGTYPNVVGASFTGDATFAGSSVTGPLTIVTPAAPAGTNFSAVSGTGPYNDKVSLTATLRSGVTPLSGKTVSFTLLGTSVGAAQTDAFGMATLQNVSLSGVNVGTYTNAVGASFAGDADYAASGATGPLTVNRASATITLGNAPLVYDGAGKSASATTSPAGLGVSFIYRQGGVIVPSPVNAGSYDVAATITDANYQGSTTATPVINKATPSLTWTNPADISYGTTLGGSQLNAAATVAGSFAYTPAVGMLLNVGSNQTLSVNFTPTDANNYNTASASVKINVTKAAPLITWDNPADITYGAALDATQLNATASAPGTFAYTPAAGTVLNAGNNQTLTVSFTPADTINYNTALKSVLVNIFKAQQTITFDQPPDRKFGDAPFALSATATSRLPVTFEVVNGPATLSGNQLTITGTGQIVVKAAQAGNANYTAAPEVVRVFQVASPGVHLALSNLTYTYDGTAHEATVTTDPQGLSVTLSYSRDGAPVQSPTDAGTYTVTATVNDPNYSGATTGVFVINKATPVLTWPTPSGINFGTALGGEQLNATSSVPGTFQYAPPSGTVLGVGSHHLSATFTPTDSVNYTTAVASVQLTVEQGSAPALSFDSAAYGVNEGAGDVVLTINRTGPATSEAEVRYATSDNSGLTDCSVLTGLASARCDYATTTGTLHFAPGETAKTISIPIVDDSYAEGPETLTVTLSNAVGESLGAVRAATVTIIDNDAATGTNPLNDTAFFIRQQYIDFLGREPDAAGFQGWRNILQGCGVTVAQPCDRIEVSSAFFRSQEFQTRGYFVYRFYPASLGRIPHYSEFMTDLAQVSGFLTDAQLEANRAAFASEFVTRAEFRNKYDALTDAAYVDALLETVGIPSHPMKEAWKRGLSDGSLTRALVLRALAESTEVAQKFYAESFVVMQYFGYLRRDPDSLYLEWIRIMNQNGGDYRVMVSGFLGSNEYVRRFGP